MTVAREIATAKSTEGEGRRPALPIKSAPDRAEIARVGRFGFFIAIIGAVLAVAVFGWRATIAKHTVERVQHGATAVKQAAVNVVDRAELTAAKARADAAATAVEAFRAERGRLTGVTAQELRAFDPALVDSSVVVVRATETAYCVQAGYGSAVAHATGPGQAAEGPCP